MKPGNFEDLTSLYEELDQARHWYWFEAWPLVPSLLGKVLLSASILVIWIWISSAHFSFFVFAYISAIQILSALFFSFAYNFYPMLDVVSHIQQPLFPHSLFLLLLVSELGLILTSSLSSACGCFTHSATSFPSYPISPPQNQKLVSGRYNLM